jgi:hypothetical protein
MDSCGSYFGCWAWLPTDATPGGPTASGGVLVPAAALLLFRDPLLSAGHPAVPLPSQEGSEFTEQLNNAPRGIK